jgi:hypothetical protein
MNSSSGEERARKRKSREAGGEKEKRKEGGKPEGSQTPNVKHQMPTNHSPPSTDN